MNETTKERDEQAGDCLEHEQPTRKRIGISCSRFYKMIADDEFPKPIKIGRSSLWPKSWTDTWIAKKVAEAKTKADRTRAA